MKKTTLLFSLGITSVIVGSVMYLLRTDVSMAFPKTSHGTFVQEPVLATVGDARVVQWTIPEECISNSFEVQDAEYKPNTGAFWGGKTDVQCTHVENGYQCQAEMLSEMKEEGKKWKIQVSSHQCKSGDYFISMLVGV